MDTGRTTIFSGGLKLANESAIDQSGFLGTRRGFVNIRWYEYTFLVLGVLAAMITDGLTIARLVKIGGSLDNPEVAYGILILVHSLFLLLFLITGIFYQRITDIVAFFLSAVLLTVYVVAHYFARRNRSSDTRDTQPEIRLARLIFTIIFNACFVPLAFYVIKDYRREEFSKRVFGAFPAARRPLQMYSVFDCVMRLSTMLSISCLLLNLYNFTGHTTLDTILLCVGIPVAFFWLGTGIGMARLENYILVVVFYILSLFQLGFLGYTLYTTVEHSIEISRTSSTTTTTAGTPVVDLVPILYVLYVCISANLVAHIVSMILGVCCMRNFNKGLKDKVFNSQLDKWIRERL